MTRDAKSMSRRIVTMLTFIIIVVPKEDTTNRPRQLVTLNRRKQTKQVYPTV